MMMNKDEANLREELALKVPGGKKNYSVSAGAGAGKTTMLSGRIAEQICQGEETSKFAVITYTNAAANELREKITNTLRGKLKDCEAGKLSLKQEEKDHISQAIASMELMQISTIHSFLLKILREHAFESKVALDAVLIDEDENQARKEDFFEEWYENHYSEITDGNKLPDWRYTNGDGNEYTIRKTILRNFFLDMSEIREKISNTVITDADAFWSKCVKEYMHEYYPKMKIFTEVYEENRPFDSSGKKRKKGRSKVMKNIKEWMDNLALKEPQYYPVSSAEEEADWTIDDANVIVTLLEGFQKRIQEGKSLYDADTDDDSQPLAYLPDLSVGEFQWNFTKYYEIAKYAPLASLYVNYVEGMVDAYQKKYDRETEKFSNNDILYRAKKLLESYPDILDYYRNFYTKIYVDEFQDTTALQTDIVRMLSEKAGTSLQSPFAPDQNKLVIVGDKKQSIYRFTGAEKAVYDEINDEISNMPSDLAEAVEMNYNFRSNSDIIDYVNGAFTSVMTGQYSPMETSWEIQEKNSLHGLFRYDIEGEFHEVEDDVKAVTELIQTMVDNPDCLLEERPDKDEDEAAPRALRKIKYSDIMVLTRSTTKMSEYMISFEANQIPVSLMGKINISNNEYLQNFVMLLRYFASPKNKTYRFEAVQTLAGLDLTQEVAYAKKKEVENVLFKLNLFFRDEKMKAQEIVRYLLNHEEFYLPKGKEISLVDIREYRSFLFQMVEYCISQCTGDLLELSDMMQEYLTTKVERQIPLVANENAIRFMNVHKAKGLTANIVIIADRRGSTKPKFSAYKHLGNYYPAARYQANKEAGSRYYPAYALDKDLLLQAAEEEMEENTRLEYVAITRGAYAVIVLPRVGRNSKDCWFTNPYYQVEPGAAGFRGLLPDIQEWCKDRKTQSFGSTVSANGIGQENTEAESFNLDDLAQSICQVEKDPALKKAMMDACVVNMNPSGQEAKGSTGYVPGGKNQPGYIYEARPRGNVFGTIMHRVYELLLMRYDKMLELGGAEFTSAVQTGALPGQLNEAQLKALEQMINQAILESRDDLKVDDRPVEIHDFLMEKMQDYFGRVLLPIMQEAAVEDGARQVYPEYSFNFYVDDGEKEEFKKRFHFETAADDAEFWVNGQADLVVKTKDGKLKVYDYKSDSRNGKPIPDFEEACAKKYAGQLDLYKYTMAKTFAMAEENITTKLIHLYM